MKKFIILLLCAGLILLIGCDEKENDMREEVQIQKSDIEEVYRQVLSQYLLEILELENYDKELSNSEMRYIPNADEDVTLVQQKDKMDLKYIYLRNELHIERLSDKEKTILLEESSNGDLSSDKVKEVVVNSFAYVITPKEIKGEADKKIETAYDSYLDSDFVTMDTLVLMIGTMKEYDDKGNYVDYSHEKRKIEELERFASEMEEKLKGKLKDIPIRVLIER